MKKRNIILRPMRKTAFIIEKTSEKIRIKLDKAISSQGKIVKSSEIVRSNLNLNPEIIKISPEKNDRHYKEGYVTVMAPSLDAKGFFGGMATLLIFAGKVAEQKKMPIKILQLHSKIESEKAVKMLDDFFKKNQVKIKKSNIISSVLDKAELDINDKDLFVCSAWWDAYSLLKLDLKRKFIYMIQDFEPIFYNNSDSYVLAENTYRENNYVPVCNTKLMYDFMSEKYPYFKKNALYFEPAVGQSSRGLSVKKKSNEKKKLFLYGRVSVARNLFNLSILAIEKAFEDIENPDEWEIVMAGNDKIPNIKLNNGLKIKNLGKMDFDEYFEFLKTIDVAICPMMAPHPNYPTLEFASVGAAVVTTKYENKTDLSSYSKNILMSELTLKDFSKTISQALKTKYDARIKNQKQNNILESWDESLNEVINGI